MDEQDRTELVAFRCPAALRDRLLAKARAEDRSMSSLCRVLLERCLHGAAVPPGGADGWRPR